MLVLLWGCSVVLELNGEFLLEDKMKDSFKKLAKFIALLGSLAVAGICMLMLLGPAISDALNPTNSVQ
jgi:hypothetical protein